MLKPPRGDCESSKLSISSFNKRKEVRASLRHLNARKILKGDLQTGNRMTVLVWVSRECRSLEKSTKVKG